MYVFLMFAYVHIHIYIKLSNIHIYTQTHCRYLFVSHWDSVLSCAADFLR